MKATGNNKREYNASNRSRGYSRHTIEEIKIKKKISNSIIYFNNNKEIDVSDEDKNILIRLALRNNKSRNIGTISDANIQEAIIKFIEYKNEQPEMFIKRPCCSKFRGIWPFCKSYC